MPMDIGLSGMTLHFQYLIIHHNRMNTDSADLFRAPELLIAKCFHKKIKRMLMFLCRLRCPAGTIRIRK